MASPIDWYGTNKTLNAPKDRTDTFPELKVFNNGTISVSCWQLTPEELMGMVQNGGKIFVAIIGGPSQNPMALGSEDYIRELAVDTGKVWAKIIK